MLISLRSEGSWVVSFAGLEPAGVAWGTLAFFVRGSGLPKDLHLTSCSCLLHALISGLLYQEYRDKSTLQEIETRRQQDAEIQGNSDGSQAGEDNAEEEEEEEEEPASPPERRALPQICLLSNPHSRFNLWQDLPEIQSSGVLDILQPEETKLQEVIQVPRLEMQGL